MSPSTMTYMLCFIGSQLMCSADRGILTALDTAVHIGWYICCKHYYMTIHSFIPVGEVYVLGNSGD